MNHGSSDFRRAEGGKEKEATGEARRLVTAFPALNEMITCLTILTLHLRWLAEEPELGKGKTQSRLNVDNRYPKTC